MDNSIGGKTLKEYITIIKIPLLALIGVSILSFLMSFLTYIPAIGFAFAIINILTGLVFFLIMVALSGYIGYITVKKYSGDLLTALVAGAIAGTISGAISGVLSLLSSVAALFFIRNISGGIGLVLALIGLVVSPIVGAILIGILSAIGGLIAGSRTFGPGNAGKTA